MASDNDTNPFALAKIAQGAFNRLVSTPDGFTITLSNRPAEEGFAVGGIQARSLVLDSSTTAVAARQRVRLWLIENEHLLRTEGMHLGGWLDTETSLYWLDFVRVFGADERDAAVAAGLAADQIAIWSLHEAEEIRL